MTEEEIRIRRPVWVALSDLWLDTDLSEADWSRIARVLADTELNLEELRQIYFDEVAPVVSRNLQSPAGEWAGFDEEWLCSAIIQNLDKKSVTTRLRSWLPAALSPDGAATEQHWERLSDFVRKCREAAPEWPQQ